ncbi:MAG: NAD-dependent epimerase/dehydratase family protein, partial [candidate division WWE3 bacterium]|nr:NAD-dependent epimerase/dehydratase family protein [candidate division WWE3 bacterium]
IGSHIADVLVARGDDVLVIDNLSSGLRENLNLKVRFEQVDICDLPKLEEVFQDFKPEAVFHLAAHIDLRESFKDPAQDAQNNIVGSLNILKLMPDFGTRKIIFSSTGGAIYGEAVQIPTSETYFSIPASPYGISKLSVEHYLNVWQKLHGIEYVALRYSNVYGPRQGGKGEAGVTAIFIKKMLKGEPIEIFGDGKQTRDYVYVADVVAANLAALEFHGSGVFNIATGLEVSVNEVYEKISKLLSYTTPSANAPAVKGEILRSALDASRAKKELGWEPKVSLEEGLRETVDFFKDHA